MAQNRVQKKKKKIYTSVVTGFMSKGPAQKSGEDGLLNNQCWDNWISIFKKKKKEQISLLSHTIRKNQFQMDWLSKCEK